jgi:lipopolysaccharide biosynthesis glycosyltransferase
MMIKSVASNKEMMNIHNFVQNLPIKDSQDFRKYIRENKPSLDLKKIVKTPSGEDIQVEIGFGVEFFRPFYGLQ